MHRQSGNIADFMRTWVAKTVHVASHAEWVSLDSGYEAEHAEVLTDWPSVRVALFESHGRGEEEERGADRGGKVGGKELAQFLKAAILNIHDT